MHCLGASGQCNSCNAMPHCLGAMGGGTRAMRGPRAGGPGVLQRRRSLPKERNSGNALLYLGALGSGTPFMHYHIPHGQWAVEVPQCTASLRGGRGQWCSYNILHCLGVVGSATRAMHYHTAWWRWALEWLQCTATHPTWGFWAVQLLQYTAQLPRGSGQCHSCNALPLCTRTVGIAIPTIHCLAAGGQYVVELLQCTATLPCDCGQCSSCNILPQCLGAVGSRTPTLHCVTARG